MFSRFPKRGKLILRFFLLLTVFFLCASLTVIFAEDIFIAPFRILSSAGDITQFSETEETRISGLLQQALVILSTDAVTYKPLPELSAASFNILKRKTVQTKLEASVVCFYEKIDYLLYGTVTVNTATKTYTANFYLYSKTTNSIIKEMKLSNQAENIEAYIATLGQSLGKDVALAMPKETGAPDKSTTTDTTTEDTSTTTTETSTTTSDSTTTATDKQDTDKDGKPVDGDMAKDKESEKPRERMVGGIFLAGYYFIFEHEWQDRIKPIAVLDAGINYEMPLTDSPEFDFSIRLAAYIQYSYANSQIIYLPAKYHSLKIKTNAEVYFQFSELFAIFAGGGIFYRYDIIDYATIDWSFYTDHVFVIGLYCVVGVEFMLNTERTFGLGILNSLDISLYTQTGLEYLLQLYIIFKI